MDATATERTAQAATIRSLSEWLVRLTRPMRVLDAVRWDDHVEAAFFQDGGRKLPPVGRDYYAGRRLSFDPDRKYEEFLDLEREVQQRLGDHPAGRMLGRRCCEGRTVVEMLRQRGTPDFAILSGQLYGTVDDCRPPLLDGESGRNDVDETLSAAEVVDILTDRLKAFFGETQVRVRLCAGIMADAAARGTSLKVRCDARFTSREVRLLEVHEGWVHLGTTLNAQVQPICTFLRRGLPSATVTQEGLAVLTEVLAGATHPARTRRLAQRVEAVALAEEGANFLEVYRYYLDGGHEPREAYRHTVRVFRGSLPEKCGPFTKDLAYSKGYKAVAAFARAAGKSERIALLFSGKTALVDANDLAELADLGLLRPPCHLPPQFA